MRVCAPTNQSQIIKILTINSKTNLHSMIRTPSKSHNLDKAFDPITAMNREILLNLIMMDLAIALCEIWVSNLLRISALGLHNRWRSYNLNNNNNSYILSWEARDLNNISLMISYIFWSSSLQNNLLNIIRCLIKLSYFRTNQCQQILYSQQLSDRQILTNKNVIV